MRARHPGSRVQFFGRYGAPGRERQRFRCVPRDGAAHTFTEPLPRLVAGHGDCVECERLIDAHQPHQSPRCYRFPAREIARTLVGLGQGQTYRQAAERARGRLAGGGESRHGQLAADWVEVFAPVVFAPHAPPSWPERGTLVLDHFYFPAAAQRHAGAQLLRVARPLRAGLRRRAARAGATAGVHQRDAGVLAGVLRRIARRAWAHRVRRALGDAQSHRGALATDRGLSLRVAPAPRARAAAGKDRRRDHRAACSRGPRRRSPDSTSGRALTSRHASSTTTA